MLKSRCKIFTMLLCLSLLFELSPNAIAQPAGGLRAGAATSNITPPLGELVVGGFSPLPADEVHDELHARAIVLDDGKTKIAFVICDNVGIPREVFDNAKQQIAESTGIPIENQLMSATHTHSATSARSSNAMVYETKLNEYQRFLANRIADSVRIAYKRLEPAKVGWGSFQEPSQLFNRRWYVVEEADRRNPFGGVDHVRMNPGASGLIRPAGPVDPQVFFFSVQSANGRPIAVLANYSLHYVGGVPARSISADYFAVFAHHLEKLLGVEGSEKPFVGILTNGTSGDVNNINFLDRSARYEPYKKMQAVGQLIASRVHESLKNIAYHDQLKLAAKSEELLLKVRKPDEAMLAYIRQVLAKPKDEKPFHVHEKTYAERVQQLAESPDEVSVLLQTIRIGSLGIAAIPFEVFTEIGLEIKEKSPILPCFTIELANGSYGYLPTPSQHDLGGYETWMGTNKVEKQASVKIVSKILDLFQNVRE
ncbi:MAG: neutral/alkaline non-lysosomal ceramidase N-terminal domain-containing protein [Pirellula sp.]